MNFREQRELQEAIRAEKKLLQEQNDLKTAKKLQDDLTERWQNDILKNFQSFKENKA